MGDKTKKHSSWAEASKAIDKAEAELAQRRSEPPPSRVRPAAEPSVAVDHLARLRRVLARQREFRAGQRTR